MSDAAGPRADFTSMAGSGPADWTIIRAAFQPFAQGLPDRIIRHLKLLDGDYGGFPVDRLQHSLQTATRAHRGGEVEEYVVAALLHDIGDTLGSYNHPEIAAAILRPFVSEELEWIVSHHGAFQAYFYFHHFGADRHLRESFRGHPHFAACARFCEHYDQSAFDSAYESAPLDFFRPMVERVFAAPRATLYRAD